jgi:predicted RNA-binding Zn-ribbon protein involved in translation (DUF1610 family)
MNIPEANLRNMLNAISSGNHVLNEQVQMHTHTELDCPDCDYDPIRKESTNYNCETCGGTGKIVTDQYLTIPASVEQQEDFSRDFTNSGKITKGQIFVTIDIKEIKEVLNTDNKFNLDDYTQLKSFVDQYDFINWKGARYSVSSFEPGFLQGNLYEIGLTLSLFE